MTTIVPSSKLGKWSVALIVLMPILLLTGGLLANALYKSIPAADGIFADFGPRPLLALVMTLGMISGLIAFVTSLIAFIKQRERALLIYLPLVLGTFYVLILLGEFIFPH